MAGCGCSKKNEGEKKECPLCRKPSGNIHYLAIKPVVKEDLKKLVQEDHYYICNNSDCDVVFFDEGGEVIFLTRDIDMKADFCAVSKNNTKCKKDCGGCKGQ